MKTYPVSLYFGGRHISMPAIQAANMEAAASEARRLYINGFCIYNPEHS